MRDFACVLFFFIDISLSVIIVQSEITTRSWIDTYRGNCLRLIGVCDFRSQGSDRACADKEWNRIDRSFHCDRLATRDSFIGPKVVPVTARRQIDFTMICTLVRYWRHQKSWSKHVLVWNAADLRVVWKVHEQRA